MNERLDPRDMSRSALENELAVRRDEVTDRERDIAMLRKHVEVLQGDVVRVNQRIDRIDAAVEHVVKLSPGGPSGIPGMETLRRAAATMIGVDDPAYEHEMVELQRLCQDFLAARRGEDFTMQLFLCGKMLAQLAVIWKLSPPGGVLDPASLFEREP